MENKKMFRRTIQISLIGILLFSLAICRESAKKADTSEVKPTTLSTIGNDKNTVIENSIPESTAFNSVGNIASSVGENEFINKAFTFLEENKAHYKISNPRAEFIVDGIINDSGWCTVILNQVKDGVKVRHGHYSINFKNNSPLTFNDIKGYYDADARNVDTKPFISEEKAKGIAINDTLNAGKQSEVLDMELIIGRFNNNLKLAWTFGLVNDWSWKYAIDAKTGEILVLTSAFRR